MKVLFVHQRLGDLGGAESTVRRLGEGLRARGIDLGLLYGESTGKGQERFFACFEQRWCWGEGELRAALAWSPDVVFVHKLDDLTVLERLVDSDHALVRMVHDHDIYCQRRHRYLPWNREICTRPAGWACGALCGVVREDARLRLAWPGDKMREIELCQRFHHHVTVSDFLKGELVLNGFDPSRITTLWPAVRDAPPSHRATYREPLVVFAGQILRGKGVDVLLEALTLLRTPGWRCCIVGDGSYKARSEELTRELGLGDRVALPGWVPQSELHRTLQGARVGVVPSVWPEPLGAVGIEMLRHGLPVVGFDVGGISEWLKDGVNGYLVPVFDRRGLAERLDTLLSNPELARTMGQEGRLRAERWCDEEQHFASVVSILEGAVARAPAPANALQHA